MKSHYLRYLSYFARMTIPNIAQQIASVGIPWQRATQHKHNRIIVLAKIIFFIIVVVLSGMAGTIIVLTELSYLL